MHRGLGKEDPEVRLTYPCLDRGRGVPQHHHAEGDVCPGNALDQELTHVVREGSQCRPLYDHLGSGKGFQSRSGLHDPPHHACLGM